jgi:hypothetical protein
MRNVRVELNAAYDLRRAPKVIAKTESIGKRVLDGANATLARNRRRGPEGEGYAMSSVQGKKRNKGRWAVRVYTRSNHAKNSNAKHNTLLRLINQSDG